MFSPLQPAGDDVLLPLQPTLSEINDWMNGEVPDYFADNIARRARKIMLENPLFHESPVDMFERIQVVNPSPESANRLRRCYEKTWHNDEELLDVIGREEARHQVRPVNGMTEIMTDREMENYLLSPNTIALELPSLLEADTAEGFVIVQHAGVTQEDHAAFRQYMEEKQFPPAALTHRGGLSEEQKFYQRGLLNGDHFYIGELVANPFSPKMSTAIIAKVVLDLLPAIEKERGRPFLGILARCLEHARIGRFRNMEGNAAIKKVNKNLGLRPIAELQDKIRILDLPLSTAQTVIAPQDLAFIEDVTTYALEKQARVKIPAHLVFALYVGSYRSTQYSLSSLSAFREIQQYLAARFQSGENQNDGAAARP